MADPDSEAALKASELLYSDLLDGSEPLTRAEVATNARKEAEQAEKEARDNARIEQARVARQVPARSQIACKRAPAIDDICENEARLGYKCWGGTVGDVREKNSSCVYLSDSHFCCMNF